MKESGEINASPAFRPGLPTLGSNRSSPSAFSLVPYSRRATCGRGRHLGSFRPKLMSASPHYPTASHPLGRFASGRQNRGETPPSGPARKRCRRSRLRRQRESNRGCTRAAPLSRRRAIEDQRLATIHADRGRGGSGMQRLGPLEYAFGRVSSRLTFRPYRSLGYRSGA